MKSQALATIPPPVRDILQKLARDLVAARKRRRMTALVMAQRVKISRPTLQRLERGDASVSIGIYGTVLFTLGLHKPLADLADAAHDREGVDLQSKFVPKRSHSARKKSA